MLLEAHLENMRLALLQVQNCLAENTIRPGKPMPR